jgi:hypothetical protein
MGLSRSFAIAAGDALTVLPEWSPMEFVVTEPFALRFRWKAWGE